MDNMNLSKSEKFTAIMHKHLELIDAYNDLEKVNNVLIKTLAAVTKGNFDHISVYNAIINQDISLIRKARHSKRCPKTGRFIK